MTVSLVPLIPRTSLFVRGMAAQCPALDAVIACIADEPPEARLKCHRLLERLFRSMPGLPRVPHDAVARLRGLTPMAVSRLLQGQQDQTSRDLHRAWRPLWREADAQIADFARRSVVVLIELFRLSRHAGSAKAS